MGTSLWPGYREEVGKKSIKRNITVSDSLRSIVGSNWKEEYVKLPAPCVDIPIDNFPIIRSGETRFHVSTSGQWGPGRCHSSMCQE